MDDDEVARRRKGKGLVMIVLGTAGVVARLAIGHTIVQDPGGSRVSDGPEQTALYGFAVLGAALIVWGLYLLVNDRPRR